MFIAKIKDTGEIVESEEFKNVYHSSIRLAKDALYFDKELSTVLIRLSKADGIFEQPSEMFPGLMRCDYVNEELLGYIAVSTAGITIQYGSVIMDIEEE